MNYNIIVEISVIVCSAIKLTTVNSMVIFTLTIIMNINIKHKC